MARAEEIRKAIALHPVQTSCGPVPVTMSLGALFSRDWGFRPAEELLQEADAALYAAKEAGRNCVKIAKPPAGCEAGAPQVNEPARPWR